MTTQHDYDWQQLVLSVALLPVALCALGLQLFIGDDINHEFLVVLTLMIIYLTWKIVRHRRRQPSHKDNAK